MVEAMPDGRMHMGRVSIRSPYRSKGRFRGHPLPLPELSGFNPLPLPKQGEIYQVSIRPVFQSAPLTEARGDSQG